MIPIAKEFEIIGFQSILKLTKWLNAIEKDKMSHQQLIDSKGFDAQTAVAFE
jgi:hypothetical protein